jgi:hypothetical protein
MKALSEVDSFLAEKVPRLLVFERRGHAGAIQGLAAEGVLVDGDESPAAASALCAGGGPLTSEPEP